MNGPDNTIQDTYRSIASPSEGLFKDNGSRFIARAYPIETEEEIKDIIVSLKKEYHDARHHCYAWRLGCGGEHFRANDDGEPSGSAGRQILGQSDSRGLSDILIVFPLPPTPLTRQKSLKSLHPKDSDSHSAI